MHMVSQTFQTKVNDKRQDGSPRSCTLSGGIADDGNDRSRVLVARTRWHDREHC